MDKRNAYEEKLAAQLDEWSAQLALLKARAARAGAEVGVDYCKVTDGLQSRYQEAGLKLQELIAASDEKWAEMKTATETAWTEVKAAFHGAASKLQ